MNAHKMRSNGNATENRIEDMHEIRIVIYVKIYGSN